MRAPHFGRGTRGGAGPARTGPGTVRSGCPEPAGRAAGSGSVRVRGPPRRASPRTRPVAVLFPVDLAQAQRVGVQGESAVQVADGDPDVVDAENAGRAGSDSGSTTMAPTVPDWRGGRAARNCCEVDEGRAAHGIGDRGRGEDADRAAAGRAQGPVRGRPGRARHRRRPGAGRGARRPGRLRDHGPGAPGGRRPDPGPAGRRCRAGCPCPCPRSPSTRSASPA